MRIKSKLLYRQRVRWSHYYIPTAVFTCDGKRGAVNIEIIQIAVGHVFQPGEIVHRGAQCHAQREMICQVIAALKLEI